MVTYTQLRTESAWTAEFVTPEMQWAMNEIRVGLGLPWANMGAKGDNAHLNGGHRSQRWILTSRYCTNRTYTVHPGLDISLTNALAAIDITAASKQQMLDISRRIDAAARAGLIEEVSAWYGNVNGDTIVDGWDNIRNVIARSDKSHLWHLHITIHRWALRNMAFFQRLVNVLLGRPLAPPAPAPITPQEEEMLFFAPNPDGTGARWAVLTGGYWVEYDAQDEGTNTALQSGKSYQQVSDSTYKGLRQPFKRADRVLDGTGSTEDA